MLFVVCIFSLIYGSFAELHKKSDIYHLNVIHINDFHARYEPTDDEGGPCKSDRCIGGFSRLYAKAKRLLNEQPNPILLNAGDNFQGSLWYTLFKWNVTQYFINKLPFDAITLGNHEFDDGIANLVPFINNLKAPVVVSNIDDSLEPQIQNTYQKSVVVEKEGKRIGIIGVIEKSTNLISNTGKLKFLDESESINAEAERLVRKKNVFTNIVLSHCGYGVEREFAKKITAASKVGLIVGGHTHTFLYTGEGEPGTAKPQGPYPTIVTTADGKTVLVVQAASYSRYLGNITVGYDNNGYVVSWSGTAIFLDTTSPQDSDINKELQPWKVAVDAVGKKLLGRSLVPLDNRKCGRAECLLGNFVTDAMVYSYTKLADIESSWTYAALAVYNPDGLRTTIEQGCCHI